MVDNLANRTLYGGLTNFGRKIIKEMNRIGMMIDLSHTSHQTQLDTLNETKVPVIFSHSSVAAICNDSRNVQDDILHKLVSKKTNKVFWFGSFTWYFYYSDTSKKASLGNYAQRCPFFPNFLSTHLCRSIPTGKVEGKLGKAVGKLGKIGHRWASLPFIQLGITRIVNLHVFFKKVNNGIIMINFYNPFLSCSDKANIDNVIGIVLSF